MAYLIRINSARASRRASAVKGVGVPAARLCDANLRWRNVRKLACLDDRGMSKRILIIQGHPDAGHRHFGHALAEAYAQGAHDAMHTVEVVNVANILGFVGIAPVHETLIGMVENLDDAERKKWLDKLRVLGRNGD